MKNFLFAFFLFLSLTCIAQNTSPKNIDNYEPLQYDTSEPLVSADIVLRSTNTYLKSGLGFGSNTFDGSSGNNDLSKQNFVEQTFHGSKNPPKLLTSFDGLGFGFKGPHGEANLRNPSDNSLAVGPNHIMQTVNGRMAIFAKKGKKYDTSGKVLYGPVNTNTVFKGFGGPCERINNGDAVVRYDQLADRWLIVMPTFRRMPSRTDRIAARLDQPGKAAQLYVPSKNYEEERQKPSKLDGSFCMCYAISTSSDPFGTYYRYEFKRDLFPDYPRPAVWPNGYYTTTSTGDHVNERHAYVVDREKMLKGEKATEQSFILQDINFVINADLDGTQTPPLGSPNIMMGTGGTQLEGILEDDGIYVWKYHVDWEDPTKTKLEGPEKITVEPYSYLCGGQLTSCVPQPGTEVRLDSQGDKIMSRLVYRKIGDRESIVAVHSVNTELSGGVRWYEFWLDDKRNVKLYQQGTFAPDVAYRWMASPAMDAKGNIGIGYSYGSASEFPGQRFAGRLSGDKPGVLTMKEVILVNGEASQTNTLRWEDYTQTAIDPSDDMTIWYVGDYFKENGDNYSTKIGAFQLEK
ncbi:MULTISPECIES: hypothetical protein [Flavobacteriaceae]|uniref:hypothetical protein n=1 Tax=Flavobacteriaceae TaxID=49546 RepID=UPI0014918B0B|nr:MULTISPECIES: hypothetical protein [Allomuricauda]MDC6366703.1 hypothetical protein [Muricauda sp. AC10]